MTYAIDTSLGSRAVAMTGGATGIGESLVRHFVGRGSWLQAVLALAGLGEALQLVALWP